MFKKAVWIGLTLSLLGFVSASNAQADEWNKKTVLTFSQAVEIPGHVLPAGTYTFKLADSMSDRHIVQVFNADGTQIIATIIAIPNYRLTATDQTVIKFSEVPAGSPEAVRAWFYPGNTVGQQFVYSKRRAAQLARASKNAVPAMAVDVTSDDDLKTAPIIAITPEETETDMAAAFQATPPPAPPTTAPAMAVDTTPVARTDSESSELPKTASALPLIVLLGFGSIIAAFGVIMFGKRAGSSAV